MMPADLNDPMRAAPAAECSQRAAPAVRARRDKLACALLCAALGSLLVYGAGFAPNARLHNAAHDARHAAGFPCN